MKTSSILYSTDPLDELIKRLMPPSLGLRVHQLLVASDELTLVMACSRSEACCPLCGQKTSRVHSRYSRTLQDLPWGTLRVRLRILVHRFFCQNPLCARQIFTQALPELAERSARRTNRLRDALLEIGWALGGKAGARLCRKQAMPVCAATLLAQLRRSGVDAFPTPRVLGVDDWGFQQQHPTGTILVDLEQHRPVDLLLGSDEEVLTQWLGRHAGVEVICRDRGAGYRKAATKGAPHARTASSIAGTCLKIWEK
jgi:transposase